MTRFEQDGSDNHLVPPESGLPSFEVVIPDERFRVIKVLGRGSFAETYLADDLDMLLKLHLVALQPLVGEPTMFCMPMK